MSNRSLAIFQVLLIAISSIGVWHFTTKDSDDKSLISIIIPFLLFEIVSIAIDNSDPVL